MFADELKGGNTARKRAEENKARRQRLKEQQEQKRKALAAAASYGTNLASVSTSGGATIGASQVCHPTPIVSISLKSQNEIATSSELSAVERAQQEREIRRHAALLKSSATRVQAYFRRRMAAERLRASLSQQLSNQLTDLETLRMIFRDKKGVEYVPPSSTITAMCTQLIFISTYRNRSTIYLSTSRNKDLITSFLEHALIPGMEKDDTSKGPMLLWMDAPEGRYRLKNLIRLCLLAITDAAQTESIFSFFKSLIVTGASGKESLLFRRYCSSLLLPLQNLSPLSHLRGYKPYSPKNSSLDMISILRFQLMYSVSSSPIPEAAQELRENCISLENRIKASSFLLLVCRAIEAISVDAEKAILRQRFLVEIMTVPLLLWKITPEAVDYLMGEEPTGSCPVLGYIQALIGIHTELLSHGKLNDLLSLQEAPLKVCPATSSQCLLANLVMLSQADPQVNGNEALNAEKATVIFNFLATVLDIVPIGTFSSRDSSVAWIDDGHGHHMPVVLSPVILDQCKLLLLDSFVRRLFQISIDIDALETNQILALKNAKDLQHEADLREEGGSSSAATLAAKEASIDRSRTFWNSSGWAKRISESVSNLLTSDRRADSTKVTTERSKGKRLMNTSSLSKKLAMGAPGNTLENTKKGDVAYSDSRKHQTKPPYDTKLLTALCRAYVIVLARWGGGGNDDLVAQRKETHSVATSKPEMISVSLLNTLCFSTNILKASWGILQSSDPEISAQIQDIVDYGRGAPSVKAITARPHYHRKRQRKVNYEEGDIAIFLYMSACTLAHSLIVTDDVEIHDLDRPLALHQLRRFICLAKELLHRVCYMDDRCKLAEPNFFGLSLIAVISRAFRDLYDRSSRRPLCVPKLWLVPDLLDKEIRQCRTHGDYVALLRLPVLRICPQLVSFKRRLKIFERIIVTNRNSIQGVNDGNPFNTNPLKPGIPVFITRGRLLEDGLATMNNLGTRMRERIAVQYINEAGARETGVDVGGLFKEFWTDLCAIAFDLNYALFSITEGTSCMYPNPSSGAAHGSDHIQLFEFVGRILGKALYEGITIQPRFAHFFLSFLRGDYNYLHMLADLSTVDSQLYNNLMFLKTYDGDARDLCLSFTITTNDFGGNEEISLVPNGADLEVTNANKHRYISLVAKHYVVDRVKEQSEAFTRGLWEVIDRPWLQIFNEPELQVLISGASDGKIDVSDLKAHTRYVGGYTGIDRNVLRFWKVFESFSPREQAELLRFVTSCERPPPLGFAAMNPPFTIQRVGILRDGEKLPSASTCFNTLKLPTYSSEKVLKERLLYAIQSGAGFELT